MNSGTRCGPGLQPCLIILWMFLTAPTCFAPISAPASIAQLTDTADLIIVGSASGGIQAGGILNFSIQVNRVIKGNLLPGISIPANWVSNESAGAANGHGLWFLKESAGGWRVLPLQSGFATFRDTFIPMQTGALPDPYAYDSSASLYDKVASEISAAIESGAERGIWANLLDQINSPVIQMLYRRMSVSSSGSQKMFGLSGLIRRGDPEAISAAIEAIPAVSTSSLEYGTLLQSIRNEFRSADPKSVATLGQSALTSTLPTDFRESAAFALRSIHTQDALPYLAALLDDPDTKLEAEAIGGLASFANGLPIQTSAGVPSLSYLQMPAHAPYKTEETMAHFAMGPAAIVQLSFWKSWWTQNKTALGY
jgi:hypothetical protein